MRITAGTTSSTPVKFMQIYVDGVKAYQSSGGELNTTVPLSAGRHRIAVQAKNNGNVIFKQVIYLTVGTVGTPTVTTTITPTTASLTTGGARSFTATVANASNTAVTWTASAGTISGSGNTATYTAPATAGTYTVTARSVADTTKSATASVTVTAPTTPQVAVSITPTTAVLQPSGSRSFTATVTGSTNTGVTWNATGGAISGSGATINYTGSATAGTYTLTATSVADPSKSARATVTISSGSVYGLSIPSGHPRLILTPENLARAKTRWASNPFTPVTWSNVEPYTDRAFIYQLTGDSSQCRTAINWALNWLSSADSNADQERWQGEGITLIYDWCYNVMTATERSNYVSMWNTRLQRWALGTTMVQNAKVQSNYWWGFVRTDIMWGIASYYENSMADTFLKTGLVDHWEGELTAAYNAGDVVGGVTQEGVAYGSQPSISGAPMATSAATLGRDIAAENGYLRDLTMYILYNTAPASSYNQGSRTWGWDFFPFGDSQNWASSGHSAEDYMYAEHMLWAAQRWANQPLGQYARQWLQMTGNNVRHYPQYLDAGGTAASLSSLPLDYYASATQYWWTRNNWNSNATVVFAQMGPPPRMASNPDWSIVGHYHYDYSSWQIWRAGRWLSRESIGYSDFVTGYNNSASVDTFKGIAHNVLLMNGMGPVGYESYLNKPTVRRMESRAPYSYFDVDVTGVYRSDDSRYDNSAVGHVEREFIFVRPLETLVIFDRLQTTGATMPKTFLMHSETNPVVDASNNLVTITNGNQVLRAKTLVPTAANSGSNSTYRVITEGGLVGQYRVEEDWSGTTASYFLHALQAKDATGADVNASVVDNGSSYTLTLTHPTNGTVTITLQKGMTSSGGSITVGGQTYNLTNGVQPVTPTANGPQWGAIP